MSTGTYGWKANLRLRNLARVVWGALVFLPFLASKLVPRRRNLWIFGNTKGYVDNSRFLFDYVYRHRPDVEAVWLTQDRDVVAEVRAKGKRAEYLFSLRGFLVAFRARVGVVTNGLGDLNRAAAGRMIIANLWHGTALKRILLDYKDDTDVGGNPILRWLSKRFLRQANQLYTFIFASSDVAADRFSTAFGLPRDRVLVTGQPRADVILSEATGDFRSYLGVGSDEKLLLYAPTWRESFNTPWEGLDIQKWEGILADHDAHLLFKPHPYTPLDSMASVIEESERIRILAPKDCSDINLILPEMDVLITDYSAVVFDWALLERPVLFFAPDYHQYVTRRGFYEPYDSFVGEELATDWHALALEADRVLSGQDEGAVESARRINKVYNAFHDTNNCERILQVLLKRTGL